MKRLSLSLILSVFSFTLFACSTTYKEVQKPPPFKMQQMTIAKGISKGVTGTPVDPSTTFTTEDPEIIAYLKFNNMHGSHKLKWDWHTPDGRLFYSSGDYQMAVPDGKYRKEYTAWHRLPVRDEKATSFLGNWQVKAYLDGQLLVSKEFTVESNELDIDKLPQTAVKSNPSNWGLVIGIEDYANLPPVDFAKRDANVVKDYFVKILGVPEENIIFLADGKATKSTIEGYLKNYLPKNMDKDTVLYTYFAGHGAPDIEKGDAYLVPYDGDPRFIAQTGYKIKDFYEDLAKLEIQRSFVFLDACFSGTVARGEKMLIAGIRPALIHVEDVALYSDKVVSLSATKGGQVSNSYPDKKHGLFTYYLLSGFRGLADADKDGWVSMGELYNYTKENVTRASRRQGVEQTPSFTPAIDLVKDVENIKVGKVMK